MSIHIWHHFDADGFCAASVVLGFLKMKNTFLSVDIDSIHMQVLEHSHPMKWDDVSTGDVIFIVDYSFTRNDDIQNILSRMDYVTFIWIDHHTSSDKLIKAYPELEKLARNGLVYTGEPKYSGCYLTYWYMLWNISERANEEGNISELETNVLLDILSSKPMPSWVNIVSDYDTFRHEIKGSVEFVKALGFVGLKNCFYSEVGTYKLDGKQYLSFDNQLALWLEHKSSSVTWIGKTLESLECWRERIPSACVLIVTKENEPNKIKDLADKGRQIIEIMSVYDAKDIKSKAFEVEAIIPHYDVEDNFKTCGSESYKILVINKMGNSLMFGNAYYEYDAVVTMHFNGEAFTYSIFSHDKGLDCEQIAVYFKNVFGITGGGHKHAAGFSTLSPVFIKNLQSVFGAYSYILKDPTNDTQTEIIFADKDVLNVTHHMP